jgi:ribosomal protein S18 acetylase RimI-like enzyme
LTKAILRAGRKADAAALAALVDIAGEGIPAFMWSQMKGPRESLLEYGRARAARESGAFTYRNAIVAEIEGEVAGCLVDYRLADPYEIGDIAATPEVVRPLIRLEAKAPGSWYVNVLAVFAEFRGHGLGTALLDLAKTRAQDNGASRLSIIVAAGNAGAMRLYERMGYAEAAREPVVPVPGCPHSGDWVLMLRLFH